MDDRRLYLFDSTLRDGAQTQGVDFSVLDKQAIAVALDGLGIDYVEGGWPGANPTDDAFFLRADDECMDGRGIQRGDLVLVNPSARARDGDAVAARVGPRCFVRTLAHRGAHLAFTPASAEEPELTVGPSDDFEVLGVVAAVLRPFHDGAERTNGNGDEG